VEELQVADAGLSMLKAGGDFADGLIASGCLVGRRHLRLAAYLMVAVGILAGSFRKVFLALVQRILQTISLIQ
jgi:hypothetical protein